MPRNSWAKAPTTPEPRSLRSAPRPITKSELYGVLARRFVGKCVHACLWHDPDVFPKLGGFDMDIIVSGDSWKVIQTLIQGVLDQCGWYVLASVQRGTVHTLLVKRDDSDASSENDFLQIDIHRFLTASGVPYVDLSTLFQRTVIIHGAPFLSPTDGAIVSILESAIMGFPPKYQSAVAFANAKRSDPDWVLLLLRQALGNRADALLKPGVPASRIWRSVFFQALWRRPIAFATIIWLIITERLAAFLHPSGLIISVCGPDGVGKSTLIKHLSDLAKRRVCLQVQVYHSRPYLIPRLARLLPRDQRNQILAKRTYEKRISSLNSQLRLAILVVDHMLGYWVKIRPRLAKGELVIFDRHFLDYRVDPRIRGIDMSQSVLRRAGALVPRPDLQVVLVADAETVFARKKDLELPIAAKQLDLYRRLGSEAGAFVLETDQVGPEQLAIRVLNRLADFRRRGQ